MTLAEQKKQANSMRNLKIAHHGYLIKDYRLDVREDGFVTAQIRVQTPYMDISAGELAQAVFAQFPALCALVDGGSVVQPHACGQDVAVGADQGDRRRQVYAEVPVARRDA